MIGFYWFWLVFIGFIGFSKQNDWFSMLSIVWELWIQSGAYEIHWKWGDPPPLLGEGGGGPPSLWFGLVTGWMKGYRLNVGDLTWVSPFELRSSFTHLSVQRSLEHISKHWRRGWKEGCMLLWGGACSWDTLQGMCGYKYHEEPGVHNEEEKETPIKTSWIRSGRFCYNSFFFWLR